MADQSDKSHTKKVSSESSVERDASRTGSDQAQANMPEHLQQTSMEKKAFDRAGLSPTARSHVSETFGRPEISEENEGTKILHVAEVSDKKAVNRSDSHLSYTRGLEVARNTAANPEEAAQMEVQFTKKYIERKLQEVATTAGKDPAELRNQHKYDPEDPNHGGTFEIPQNVADKHPDGSVLLKINVAENVQARDDTHLRSSRDGWLEAGRRIAELPLDKQFEIIGSGLAAGINQYQHDENQRAWGRAIGTVQGLGAVSTNLATVADFSAALIMNDEDRAGKMGAEFGQALGETIVGGVRLFSAADQYLFSIGFTGDYAKPFRDIVELGNSMNRKWESLPPKEQERIKSKLLTELGADTLIGGAGIHTATKAGKFTEFLDDFAGEMAKQGAKTLDGAKDRAKAIKEGVEDLMLPEAVTPDGRKIKIRSHREPPDTAVYSQAHDPGGSGIPHPERPSGSDSRQQGEHIRHREADEDIFKPKDLDLEITEALKLLEQPLLDFLRDKDIKVKVVDMVSDVFPDDPTKKKALGAFDWGRNTIFISKRVTHGGNVIDNFDIDFVVRHEIGHAVNSKSLEKAGLYYSKPIKLSDRNQDFVAAFDKDLESVPDEVLRKLNFDKTTEEGLRHARDEVFADTFAHATGFSSKNSWSQLLKQYFRNALKLAEEDANDSF